VYKDGFTPAIAYWIVIKEEKYFSITMDNQKPWQPDYWLPLPSFPESKCG